MKKIVIAMMMMVGLVATSYGIVNVNWTASAGFYFAADPFTGILGADDSGNSTIAQLMYSSDAVQDAAFTLAGIDTTGAGTGNDVIWDTLTITADGSLFAGYALFPATQVHQQTFTSGFVYAMIFQDSVIGGNDWYYYTPMLALEDVVGPAVPQGIELNSDLTNGNAIDSGTTVGQVVPEPATFLLFGIGGFGAFLLRRRQQA